MTATKRLVYSPQYDIDIPGADIVHPFDGRRYSRAYALAAKDGDIAKWTVAPSGPANPARDFHGVHTAKYLASLSSVLEIARILELPRPNAGPLASLLDWIGGATLLRRAVLTPMLWATAGTILAAELAVRGGSAINMSGGYHHAGRERGEGFCVYADVAIAIHHLWATGLLGPSDTVAYIDLDAHQGNGVARIFEADPRVHIFDMYNRDIYPWDGKARKRINRNVPLLANTPTNIYLNRLRTELPEYLMTLGPGVKFAVYNAGTDIYEGDRLGGLQVSAEGVFERDRFVIETFRAAGIPWLMVPSGGYSPAGAALLANTVRYALDVWRSEAN
jgi:histone deacetylase 11